jgi:hypothetical protein
MELADFKDLNYLAVLAGAVAYWLVGALWYSPVLFGKAWQRLTGVTPETAPSPMLTYLGGLVLLFVTTVGLGYLSTVLGLSDLTDGIQLGLGVSIAFVTAQLVLNAMYEKRPRNLVAINAGYAIVGITLASIIVVLWD